MANPLTLNFDQLSAADLPRVGGKGANLGEMTRAGFPVPPGFCVTTDAFQQFMAASQAADELYPALEALAADDVEGVRRVGQQVRERLRVAPIPSPVAEAFVAAWETQGTEHPYAVRSSATAEDLPDASFAGQQDTYLNVIGRDAMLNALRDCWVSLFTDRAILYRAQNGFSHRAVALSVVVQRMILPQISGILFTADPVNGHRQIISIDASYGLGEALVSGLVSADLYKIDKRDGQIVETQVADKGLAIWPKAAGGTYREELTDERRTARVLNEGQLRQLADLGTRVESHYGSPQDLEWCIDGDQLYLLQARPITSLFPRLEPPLSDNPLHVLVSFGHAQVMTDPLPPMASSVWRILLPFGKKGPLTEYNPYLHLAAGRIYINLSPMLRLPPLHRILPKVLAIAAPHIAATVRDVIDRDEFKHSMGYPRHQVARRTLAHWLLPLMLKMQAHLWLRRPEGSPAEGLAYLEAEVEGASLQLNAVSPGAERLKVAHQILGEFFPRVLQFLPYIGAAGAARLILSRLLGDRAERADFDNIFRGLSGNVTTDMDLVVGDLADLARKSPELARHLSQSSADALKTVADLPGGPDFMKAWVQFMARYGMRGPSEIDISRPRWADAPDSIFQVLVGNLQHGEAGRHRAQHRRMAADGQAAADNLVAAARYGPLGFLRAALARRLVRVTRSLMAVREHPKYMIIRFLGLLRPAILEAADILQTQNRIDTPDDVWFLGLPELITALETPTDDLRPRIAHRRADIERFHRLSPPQVLTSDGEIPTLKPLGGDIPAGALPGIPVSAGVVEGIARVVLDPAAEVLKPGEILVAPFTDPGWTPLFINAAGLVMEVGGLMTHGSVVAREYGIPAVVGVLDATRHIQSGQHIRLQGDLGYVEIIER